MAASGMGSMVFIDDVSSDESYKMLAEAYRNILSTNIQRNAIKLVESFIMQEDDPIS